ncbi:MAG: class I SAM-dependent methyltransferase [Ktedonobacteraceae bacterium]
MHDPQQSPESFEAQQRFTERYLEGTIPWDTGISPPELLEVISGPNALPPGRALDIGCGTGTNSLTLARLGWQVLGVDFAEPAIDQAIIKTEDVHEEIARAGGGVRFLRADITCLEAPSIPYTLVFDLGCLNGIPYTLRSNYARIVAEQAAPGALFLVYIHLPNPDRKGPIGCTLEEIEELFGRAFILERQEMGYELGSAVSMWNWLHRRS